MKKIIFFQALLLMLVFLSSISGVFATWNFAEEPATDSTSSLNVNINEFVWAPEEILPTVTPGQNFLDLYDSILNNSKAGLNSSKNIIFKAVSDSKYGLLHSSQNVQGGNLKHLFVTSASRELDFVVQYISDNELRLYLYKEADTTGAINVTKINVYMTIVKKENNAWNGVETQFGTATLQYFPGTNVVSIDVDSWEKTSKVG